MKALWAFEPASQNPKAIQGMHRLLSQFVGAPKQLELGFVITGNESYLYTAYDVPPEDRFTTYPKELIEEDLRKARVAIPESNMHLVDFETLRTTKAVDRLLALAKSRGADLLALHTRSKRGLDRLILGSFAETAVHRSKIDLLMVSPHTSFAPKVRKILFASDFSAASKRKFSKVLALCKSLGAGLTVFHSPQIIYRWSLDEENPEIQAYRRGVKQSAEWFESAAKKAKVSCKVEIDTEFSSVPELILASAKKNKADLLVVSAETGPVAALMGGSVIRNLLRYGKLPILVLKR